MKIIGYGRTTGRVVETADALEARLRLEAGVLSRGVGITRRASAGPDQDQLTLGVRAIRAALGRAELELGDIDLLISAASVPYQPIPSLSAILLDELAAPAGRLQTFDVNATCLSFLTALNLVQSLMASGGCRRAIIVSSEVPTRSVDMASDPRTGAIFSDGAAALVLEAGAGFDISAYRMRTYPKGRDYCRIASGGTRYPALQAPEELVSEGVFRMHGERLMTLVARQLPRFVKDLHAEAGLAKGDIDLIVPHQASPHAMSMIGRISGLPSSRVVDTAALRGNRVAASLPDTLIEAIETGRVPGSGRIMMIGTSAGVSIGGAVIEVRP